MSATEEELDLDAIAKAVATKVAKLSEEIQTLETAVRLKRDERGRLRGVLRGIDPSLLVPLYKTNGGGGGGKKKKSGASEPSRETMQEIVEWLQKNKAEVNAMNEGAGIFSSQAVLLDDFPLSGQGQQSRASKGFRRLQEQGVVRLNSVGGMGGRKYYKVI